MRFRIYNEAFTSRGVNMNFRSQFFGISLTGAILILSGLMAYADPVAAESLTGKVSSQMEGKSSGSE